MRKYFYMIGQKNKRITSLAHKLGGPSSILEGEYQIEENLFTAY